MENALALSNSPLPEPLPMSGETRERLLVVAKLLKGKEAFPEKVARAKRLFKGLKTLPL